MRLVPLAFLFAFGCVKPVCLRGETRCAGAAAEVCLSDRTWKTIQNCTEVAQRSGGSWVCCDKPRQTGTGATCVPEAVCQ